MARTRILPIPMGSGSSGDSYTKAEIDAMLLEYAKLVTTDLVNYYDKTETYTQAEIQALVGQITSFEVVATLPVSDIKTNVIYLLGPSGTGADKYEEYIYSNNTWVKIGETSVDLSNYVTVTQLNTALGFYTTTQQLNTLLAGKQDTLTAGDGITIGTDGTISADIPTLATVATTGDYEDLTNKPTIPVVPTLATVATSGSYNDLTDKPDIPIVPTLATVATSGSYNDLTDKPTAGDGINISTSNVISAESNVISMTQAEYDQITPDPDKIYIITDATPVTLATVATSGSYNDLTDKPDIPAVGTGVVTFTSGGATIGTFGANDATDKTIDIPAGGGTAVSGTNDGTNWTSLTIGTETYDIPGGAMPTLATVATTGSYNDLTDKLTAGSGISIGTDNVISATGGGTDNTFELSGEAQSDLADLYLELTTNGRSLGPTTIENWLMDNRVTYYGYPIVSAFVGDYTVDNNGNLAPISPRSAGNTKAPVQVDDTKVVFGYYPDVRVSGQTVGMKYVLLQSDGTLATAVDTITITSGGGKNIVEMSTDDQVTSQQEWADLYDAIDADSGAWFEANTLVIDGYECDRWENGWYILDDNSQVISDNDEQEQVYAFWCSLEILNDAKVFNDTTYLSHVDYAVYLLHSDGAVDAGVDTLTLKPVVELSRIDNGDTGYGEYIYNWIIDHSIDDFMMLNAVYYYGQPVNSYIIGLFTTDGDGHLVEDLSLQEDTVVFQLDNFVQDGIVSIRYILLFSDGTSEVANTVIDLTNSVTLNFTDSNNVTTSYTFYIHPSR